MPTLNLGRVGFVNKGNWSISTTYKINDVITYNHGTYAALQAHTGQTPISGGSAYWQEWVTSDNTAFVANAIHSAASKITPVDADEIPIADSAATFGLKKLTWANLKATILSSFGAMIDTATAKGVPIDADIFIIGDSAVSNASKKLSLGNLKAVLLTYFDTLYSRTSAIFAIGQTWQSVTGTRALTTTYTNSTGKAIMVAVGGTSTVNSYIVGVVAGSQIIQHYVSAGNGNGVIFIVPIGATYSVTFSGGTNTLTYWNELR